MGFKIGWALVVKTGVESGAVVEGLDVIEDGGTSFGEGGETVVVNQFIFEATKKAFDKSVIVAVAFASHGSGQIVLSEELAISGTGELATAIGVDDE